MNTTNTFTWAICHDMGLTDTNGIKTHDGHAGGNNRSFIWVQKDTYAEKGVLFCKYGKLTAQFTRDNMLRMQVLRYQRIFVGAMLHVTVDCGNRVCRLMSNDIDTVFIMQSSTTLCTSIKDGCLAVLQEQFPALSPDKRCSARTRSRRHALALVIFRQ